LNITPARQFLKKSIAALAIGKRSEKTEHRALCARSEIRKTEIRSQN
jgi:hypothetical protein